MAWSNLLLTQIFIILMMDGFFLLLLYVDDVYLLDNNIARIESICIALK